MNPTVRRPPGEAAPRFPATLARAAGREAPRNKPDPAAPSHTGSLSAPQSKRRWGGKGARLRLASGAPPLARSPRSNRTSSSPAWGKRRSSEAEAVTGKRRLWLAPSSHSRTLPPPLSSQWAPLGLSPMRGLRGSEERRARSALPASPATVGGKTGARRPRSCARRCRQSRRTKADRPLAKPATGEAASGPADLAGARSSSASLPAKLRPFQSPPPRSSVWDPRSRPAFLCKASEHVRSSCRALWLPVLHFRGL